MGDGEFKQNVLILDNSQSVTGAFNSILSVTRSIAHRQFYFAIPTRSGNSKILATNQVQILLIPFLELRKDLSVILYLPMLLANTVRLLRFMKRESISVVHVNDMYNMCGVLIKLFRPDTRLLYHIRLLPSSYVRVLYSKWKWLILKFADEVICVSKAVAASWPAGKRVHVIHDAIDLLEKLPLDRNFEKEQIIFLYLANYIRGKGQQYALDSFNKVHHLLKNTSLVFVGSDMGLGSNKEFKFELQQKAHQLGIEGNVLFKDFSAEVERDYKQADIFLNFSDSESFSMTCLEALYYGTPCIVTNSGGPSEIIVEGKCGLIVPVADVDAMERAMISLATSVDLRRKFSEYGRARARNVFSIDGQAEKLDKLYDN